MEKLNARQLAEVLRALGEPSSGGKSVLYCRLEAALMDRNMKYEDALASVSKSEEVDIENELAPGDSISQVGEGIGVGNPDQKNVLDGLGSTRRSGGSLASSRRRKTGSVVSRISRAGSCLSTTSSMLRIRELEVQRLVQAAAEEKAIHIEQLRMQQQLARQKAQSELEEKKRKLESEVEDEKNRLEEEKRRLESEMKNEKRRLEEEKRKREAEEMREEMELEMEIKSLERQARDDALRVEAEAWARFEVIDAGTVQGKGTRLNVEDIVRDQTGAVGKIVDRGISKSYIGVSDRSRIEEWDKENFDRQYHRNGIKGRSRDSHFDSGDLKLGVGNGRTVEPNIVCSENILRELAASNVRIGLPKHKIECFDGDATQYTIFKGSMAEINRSDTLSYTEKLHYVYQHTSGEPRELVKGALYMDPKKGYEEIWKWFEEKYGAPEKIGSEFVDGLLNRNPVARDDVEGLKAYAVSLRLTKNVLDMIPHGRSELDHPKTIRALVSKLHFGLQEKWRVQSTEKKHELGEYLGYEDLIKFVEKAARTDSDPLYGKQAMQRASVEQLGKASQPRKRVVINAVSYGEDMAEENRREFREPHVNGEVRYRQSCFHCAGAHRLDHCRIFKQLEEDERQEVVRDKNLCFICLQPDHRAAVCSAPKVCDRCNRYHHTLLHREGRGVYQRNRGTSPNGNVGGSKAFYKEGRGRKVSLSVDAPEFQSKGPIKPGPRALDKQGHSRNRVLISRVSAEDGTSIGSMNVLPVVVKDKNGAEAVTSAFLDPGSAVSFCTTGFLDRLGVRKEDRHSVNLCTETMHDKRWEQTALVSGLMVRGKDEVEWLSLPPIYVVNRIPVSSCDVLGKGEIDSWEHLEGLGKRTVGSIDLMIGMNAPGVHEPLEIITAPRVGEPYAIRTRIGTCVMGLLGSNRFGRAVVNRVGMSVGEVRALIDGAFERGFEGMSEDKLGMSVEDERWVQIVEEGCKRIEGHYEIPLPLKDMSQRLPDSRCAALKRALGLRKKLENNKQLRDLYEESVNDMIEKGYAEKVVDGSRGKWYLPHFNVQRPDKPGKVRVVYDCAAKVQGVALNDLLLQGPDLATHLLEVLLRFREGTFAFTADVNAMFHQVRTPERCRDYLRFFWWDGGVLNGVLSEYRMAVHLFGATSSPSVANYALRRVADEAGGLSNSRAANALKENFYVDDCLVADCDRLALAKTAVELRDLCSSGGFDLRKFSSNIHEIEGQLGEGNEILTCHKVLGVTWDKCEDKLGIMTFDLDRRIKTRRELLGLVAKVYDPLGIAAPVVLQGRLIFQSIIRRDGVGGWDEKLVDVDIGRIDEWKSNLSMIEGMCVPRSITVKDKVKNIQLHIFGDASESGHAAVAYSRIEFENGMISCTFILGKARVNPTKYVSVPRLELVASTLVARLSHKLREALNTEFHGIYLWTDSMTVLRYLRNDRIRFHSFVANRVSEIRRRTYISEWRYVDSKANPADDGSRGVYSDRWRDGPQFLRKSESEWPMENVTVDDGDDIECGDPEVRKCHVLRAGAIESFVGRIAQRYSDWIRLVRAIAWLTKFRDHIAGSMDNENRSLSVCDRERAEKTILKAIQSECFGDEYVCLKGGQQVRRDSSVFKLGIFMKDELIRVGGRLGQSFLSYDQKHPILLPSDHIVTSLIIRDAHVNVGHMGISTVLGFTRDKFWIVRGYSAIRKQIRTCLVCKRVQGKPIEQRMADLPEFRVTDGEPAFTYVGVDCFGPYHVAFGRGKKRAKRYGVLFTCMTMRAVHLEVAQDLSAEAIMRAIRRFMARRGKVKLFCSDNGTNFVGARREILDTLGAESVRHELGDRGVRWEFNPPRASHFGGIWESVIKTARRVLEAVMNGKVFSEDCLATIFCEAEAVMNSRPLVIVGEDPDEDVLSPQRLLNLGTSMDYQGKVPDTIPEVVKRWVHIQSLAQQFWKRWCREYRSSLQGRGKWISNRTNVAIGDIVLIIDETEQRCHWPIGRIEEVRKSKDGLVRSVTVRAKGRTYERPVAKLIMMIKNQSLP